jgi:transketolase
VMLASHHFLDNINIIIDNNKISMLGYTEDIVSHGCISSRLQAFGWDTIEVDGHDVEAVHKTLKRQKNIKMGKPKAIIANTIKGFGVPEIENEPLCHITNPKPETIDQILGVAQ